MVETVAQTVTYYREPNGAVMRVGVNVYGFPVTLNGKPLVEADIDQLLQSEKVAPDVSKALAEADDLNNFAAVRYYEAPDGNVVRVGVDGSGFPVTVWRNAVPTSVAAVGALSDETIDRIAQRVVDMQARVGSHAPIEAVRVFKAADGQIADVGVDHDGSPVTLWVAGTAYRCIPTVRGR